MKEALEHSEATHNLLPKQDGPVREQRDMLALTPREVLTLLQEFLTEVCAFTAVYLFYCNIV